MAFHVFEQFQWLTQTKFIFPVLRSDVFVRPRLTQVFQQAFLTDKVVLVSAPAGYGKTTLMSTLPVVLPDLPMAWFSLDEGDNDPLQFVFGLVTALKQLNSALSQRLCALLATTFDLGNQHIEMHKLLIGSVINDVVDLLPQSFVLMLDDLHRISNPETYAALDYLIERLPRQMHLVISTRYDPPLALARLRARGQLEELRIQDLRFRLLEVATFLNVGLKLDLSEQDIVFLHAHIEGWAAGLRLLANSFDCLPHQLDRDSLLRNLARNERHVYDFLADEVLNQQEVAIRSFLLKTSILTELTPTLCQAVTKCQDVVVFLEELYRYNLTIAVEQRQHVYRYHDLFKAFLQQHLARESPQLLTELHLQAADAETVPSRIIHHYLEAQLWEEAAVKMEQLGGPLLQEGLLITVCNWVNALPLTICQQHPRLLYYLGISAWQRGDTAMVKELLQRAIEGFAASGDTQEQGESLVILANACISDRDIVKSRIYLEEALHFPLISANRALALMTRVWQENWLQDWEQAARNVDEAILIGLAEPDVAVWNTLGLLFRAGLSVLPDGLARIERFWHNSVPHQFAKKNMVLKASLSSLQAFTYLMRGRIDEAAQANERVLQGIDELEGAIWLIGDVLIISIRLYLARNDIKRLDRLVEFIHRFKSYPFFETYRFVSCYLEGRVRWQQGRIEEAQQIFRAFPFSDELADAQFLRFFLQALLEIAHQQYSQAEVSLKAAQELVPKCVLALYIADVAPILAYLYMQWDKPKKALAELVPILAKCEAENTPGHILQEGAIMFPVLELALKKGCHVDFTTKLLHMMGHEVTLTEEALGSNGCLSVRETEVLRLLAEGLSNREIANQLIISELTVKSHVTHLLRKLDVPSRSAAVTRARQLDWLP